MVDDTQCIYIVVIRYPVELKHIRYFVAVADELHFTKAAYRLHMSQPPLSQLIRRLEESLGFKLFERTKRKVVLTNAGQILLQESRGILARVDLAVERAARAARGGGGGHLKVAFIPWVDFTSKFSDVFSKFSENYPDVTIDFYSMQAAAASVALIEGRVDVAILSMPPLISSSLNGQLLLSDHVVVALPEDHILAKMELVPLKLLEHEAHIVVAPDRIGSFYEAVVTLCQQSGFTLKPRHTIDHPQTTLALVSAGVGVSLVPSSYQNGRRSGIVYRPIEPTMTVSIIVVWRREEISPVVRTFLEVLQSFAPE